MQILLLSIEKTSAGMFFFDKTTPHNYSFYEERHIIIITGAGRKFGQTLAAVFVGNVQMCEDVRL
jgi:hypothetical protein